MLRQHAKLVGIYSWASVGAVVVVLAAEIIRIILHFTLKVGSLWVRMNQTDRLLRHLSSTNALLRTPGILL